MSMTSCGSTGFELATVKGDRGFSILTNRDFGGDVKLSSFSRSISLDLAGDLLIEVRGPSRAERGWLTGFLPRLWLTWVSCTNEWLTFELGCKSRDMFVDRLFASDSPCFL